MIQQASTWMHLFDLYSKEIIEVVSTKIFLILIQHDRVIYWHSKPASCGGHLAEIDDVVTPGRHAFDYVENVINSLF